jgi:hypothetical protein
MKLVVSSKADGGVVGGEARERLPSARLMRGVPQRMRYIAHVWIC